MAVQEQRPVLIKEDRKKIDEAMLLSYEKMIKKGVGPSKLAEKDDFPVSEPKILYQVG